MPPGFGFKTAFWRHTKRGHDWAFNPKEALKRFTETEKWRDPWFRKLPPHLKCLWQYICDVCCPAGTFDLDWELVSFVIGKTVTPKDFEAFAGRIDLLSNGRYLVVKFIEFQYGTLSKDCRPHDRIFKAIEQNQIPYPYPRLRVEDRKKIGKEEEEEEDKTGKEHFPEVKTSHSNDARAALLLLNELTGSHYRETDTNLGLISARLAEPGVTLLDVKVMLERKVKEWKGTDWEKFLRPETLFGKQKFESYFGQRNQPVITNGQTGPKPANNNPSMWALKTKLEALTEKIKKLRNCATEGPMGDLNFSGGEGPEYYDLLRQKRELNDQISKFA